VTVQASSPITGQSYALHCRTVAAMVTCTGGSHARVRFPLHAIEVYAPVKTPTPPATPTSSPPPASTTPAVPSEDVGSMSHAGDAQFCSKHPCIPNFPNGNGAVVKCADGEYSHSGGLSGACSSHGGEQ
jgi:hypothetical protein